MSGSVRGWLQKLTYSIEYWHLTVPIVKKILLSLGKTGLFTTPARTKLIVFALLLLSLIGPRGKKDEKINPGVVAAFILVGTVLYFCSTFLFFLPMPADQLTIAYTVITALGYLLALTGGARLSRLIKLRMNKDPFNELNESFPQEERLLENEYSLNFPALYNLKGKTRKSYINFVNPHRAVLLIGSPGAGKSRYVINPSLRQAIEKGYCVFCYDYKYPDLTNVVYNTFLKHRNKYPPQTRFYNINFDYPEQSHRCNPLEPESMHDITDAAEASRTILLALNRDWIKKQGEFFTESAINFVTACMWFLRKYRNGKYCTLPHLIEFMQTDYDDLFPILSTEPEVEIYVNPFISAYMNRALEQLEGQVASAKIAMARLSSPQLYYTLNGNDFTLDINNPEAPKIVCMGNNPLKIQTYGAVLSLYTIRLIKLVNQKHKLKSMLVFDEYPTIYTPLDHTIASARSNLVCCLIAVQSIEQIRKDYGKELADVVMNICGNIICGQTTGETAKHLSEMFGRIVQERESVSINRTDTNISKSSQLDHAVPASKIAGLSSGEFVGWVADNPHEPIKLKNFHCKIVLEEKAIAAEEAGFQPLPKVRDISVREIQNNYIQIKNDVYDLVEAEIERIKNDKELSKLLFVKPDKGGETS